MIEAWWPAHASSRQQIYDSVQDNDPEQQRVDADERHVGWDDDEAWLRQRILGDNERPERGRVESFETVPVRRPSKEQRTDEREQVGSLAPAEGQRHAHKRVANAKPPIGGRVKTEGRRRC